MFDLFEKLSPESIHALATDILAIVAAGTALATVLVARAAMVGQAYVTIAEKRSWLTWDGHFAVFGATPDTIDAGFDLFAEGASFARDVCIVFTATPIVNGRRRKGVRRTVWFDRLDSTSAPERIVIPFEPFASGAADVEVDFCIQASYCDYALRFRRQWLGSVVELGVPGRNIRYPVGKRKRITRFHQFRFWTR